MISNKRNIVYWVAFFLAELLVFAYFKANRICCEPCLPGTYCEPCICQEQIVSFWTGLLIAAFFLIWQLIRIIKNKKHERIAMYKKEQALNQ